ncbi:MAG: hypothetical protein WC011_02465 [Candidatus Paceibacterota bacterium]
MSLIICGTKDIISIPVPKEISCPLTVLLELQKIFNTEVLGITYGKNSPFLLKDHNLFCITTNNKGLFDLCVKNGTLSFYEQEHSRPTHVDLSALDVSTVLLNFFSALKKVLYSEIRIELHSTDATRTFSYRLSIKEDVLLRESLDFKRSSDF